MKWIRTRMWKGYYEEFLFGMYDVTVVEKMLGPFILWGMIYFEKDASDRIMSRKPEKRWCTAWDVTEKTGHPPGTLWVSGKHERVEA